jgi:hypothetical protein
MIGFTQQTRPQAFEFESHEQSWAPESAHAPQYGKTDKDHNDDDCFRVLLHRHLLK